MGGGIVVIFFVIGLMVLLMFSRFAKSASLLDQWALENGFRLIESQRKDLFRGPYLFTTSKSQVVYWIVVEDAQGNRRSGYARVGGYMTGLLSDRVDVKWDD